MNVTPRYSESPPAFLWFSRKKQGFDCLSHFGEESCCSVDDNSPPESRDPAKVNPASTPLATSVEGFLMLELNVRDEWFEDSGNCRHGVEESAGDLTPEQIFERRWALTLLDTTMEKLRSEYADRNHTLLFESLHAHMNQDQSRVPYAKLGRELSMTEDAIKQSARRLKLRYREILRAEIANTLGSVADVDDELRQLMNSLSPAR